MHNMEAGSAGFYRAQVAQKLADSLVSPPRASTPRRLYGPLSLSRKLGDTIHNSIDQAWPGG